MLPEQGFVKDNSVTVGKYLGDASVKRFVRYEIGAETPTGRPPWTGPPCSGRIPLS